MFQHNSLLCQVKPQDAIRQLLPGNLIDLLGLTEDLPDGVHKHKDFISRHTFVGKRGYINVDFDGIRLLIQCYNAARLIFRGALRDRQLDGTERRSPLTIYPNSHPACNLLPDPLMLAAELSIYSWSPDHFLDDIEMPGTLGHFVNKPDLYLWAWPFNKEIFDPLFDKALEINRAPWQISLPIPGAARHFVTNAAVLLTRLGYHRVDEVPSWFNVVEFFKKLGFQFTFGEHAAIYDKIVERLGRFADRTVQEQSWLVALQNTPEKQIEPQRRLSVRWPVTHIEPLNQYWVRMHRDLNPLPESDRNDQWAAQLAEERIRGLLGRNGGFSGQ